MSYQQSWHEFSTISFALVIGTMGTALASPLYPIYQRLWQLQPSDITYIFVAYMLGCLATLLFLGRLSNYFGFLRSLQFGILLVMLGLGLSIIAEHALFLGFARFIIGIASGLITTSAMLGMLHSIPTSHQSLAPQLSSVIAALGFGLGPLVGGLIAQLSTAPLVTPYVPVLMGSIVCFIDLCFLPKPQFVAQPFSIRPRLQMPIASYRASFCLVGFAAFSAFAAFSLFASLSSSFVVSVLPNAGPLISGFAIALILFISALIQFFARRLEAHRAIDQGLIGMILSLILLALAMQFESSWLFFISDILVGIGHGLTLLGAFALVHRMSQEHNRAALISSYLFIAYLGTILPIIAAGVFADYFGLTQAIFMFCIAMTVFCFILLYWHTRLKQQKALV